MRLKSVKGFVLFCLFIALFIHFTSGNVIATIIPASEHVIANQYIVVFSKEKVAQNQSDGVMDAQVADRLIDHVLLRYGSGDEKILSVYRSVFKGFAAVMDKETALMISQDPLVAFVEEDSMAVMTDIQTRTTWGIDRIDQRDLPLSGTYTYENSGDSVHAYILDTGINAAHSEFSHRVGEGFDAVGDGHGTGDFEGHGTHIAGTVGGTRFGVAKEVILHPVQVLNSKGMAPWSTVIKGVEWVTENHEKPAVANMSIGGAFNQSLNLAVEKSIEAGVVYTVASGNSDMDACQFSPSGIQGVITAAATTPLDQRRFKSNWGPCVDIFAPGTKITSASHLSNNGFDIRSGSSMAAAHLCGVVALFLESYPEASPAMVKEAIEMMATQDKVVDPKGSPNRLLFSLFDDDLF